MDESGARWLVVGLGNPGPRYAFTRHNVGFWVVDAIVDAIVDSSGDGTSWKNSTRFNGDLATGAQSTRPLVLLKPQTYMNLSGESVGPVARFYRIPVEQIIAIHDDVDLELGRLKIKQGGGDGGHRGIRSIDHVLGDSAFVRVRFGVGRPPALASQERRPPQPDQDVADHVLSDFRAEERERASEAVTRAAAAVRAVISRGLKEAMNRFNRPPKQPTPPKPPEDRKTLEKKSLEKKSLEERSLEKKSLERGD